MGGQEKIAAQKRRRGELQKIILQTVGAAGVMSVALVAPNVIGAMGKMGLVPSRRQSASVTTSWKRLQERGLIRREGSKIHLTAAGKRYLESLSLADGLKKPRRWDGRWRVLIFDIPERQRRKREHIRRMLLEAGFVKLQGSVWLYPYDCEDFITLIKADLRIGKDVLYLIVESLEYDKPYRKHFGLEKK